MKNLWPVKWKTNFHLQPFMFFCWKVFLYELKFQLLLYCFLDIKICSSYDRFLDISIVYHMGSISIQRFSVLFSNYFIEYPSFCLYKWNLAKLKLNLFQTIQFGYPPTVDYFSVHQFPTYRLLPCIHKSLINTFLFH